MQRDTIIARYDPSSPAEVQQAAQEVHVWASHDVQPASLGVLLGQAGRRGLVGSNGNAGGGRRQGLIGRCFVLNLVDVKGVGSWSE